MADQVEDQVEGSTFTYLYISFHFQNRSNAQYANN